MTTAPLTVGSTLPAYVVPAVDPEKMKLMAAILRDPNPIHFDPDSVAALGLGTRVVNQGPATLSYVADCLTGAVRGRYAVRSLSARMLGNVFAGDRVECGGEVTGVDEESGLTTIELFARVAGTDVVRATATVQAAGSA